MAGTEAELVHQIFMRYLAALESTQWQPLAKLIQYQGGLTEALVRHARDNVPFYRDRLACLFGPDGRCDLSRWHEVPVLTRTDAPLHAAAMRAERLPDVHGAVQTIETSGSTGTPLPIAYSRINSIAANVLLTRLARWWGADTSRPLARIRLYKKNGPQYPDGKDWRGWSHADQSSHGHDLDLLTPYDQQLDWLLRKKAPYLMTSASNATALAYTATPEQAHTLGLELIFAIAETVLPRAREIVAERLGAPLIAIYSCEELGFIATQCPHSTDYHVCVESVLVEILRDDGSPAAPGEAGQVVLTGLYNYAMPFIRYAIGDVAIAAEGPCSCGRGLPLIAQVLGRTRNAFVFADGTRMWPRFHDAEAFRAVVPYREFQMVQLDHRRIEFRYEPDGSAVDAAGAAAIAQARLHPSVEIVLKPMERIPRGSGGKLEHFVTLVKD